MTRFSYVAGDWVATDGDSVEDLVPTALEHARTVGLPGVARLTFHDRARLVLRLAEHLNRNSDSLYRLSAEEGATRRDAQRDIEGAPGAMRHLAEAALRDLSDSTAAADGPLESPGPGEGPARMVGQHLYVSTNGVGILVNELNFLLWGSAARVTPAFLAGVPLIVRPARQTSSVAAELTRLIVDSKIMPPGNLQLLNGQTETFWDYLKFGDHVFFTGSSRTGLRLAKQPKVMSGRVRLTLATESVNAAVLGPADAPGTPVFEALVRCVAREMTNNAGQTCTAIRRVLVPRPLLKSFAEALCHYLDRTVVLGDPADLATTMGPLADHDQLRRLNRQVKELITFGGRVVRGGGKARNLTGPYYEPTVLVFDQPSTVFCDVEPFGPVVSIACYETPADAIRLSNDGGKSLVITVASSDFGFLAQVARGVAPYHDRVHLLDGSVAGAKPPRLLSPGGPTGHCGSEELSGVRSIRHWMHRVAIEGAPGAVKRLTGPTVKRGAAEPAAVEDAASRPARTSRL
ncbi:MAG: aldehyde dehydrogenase family protein [Bifidobacteriaceae bacterium]|jgi:oxepin-CoA hydrolase/3-oxo-5,6-dehydrosuberyl-CoA semialdehyde dehydrogenase|nr:aldehyde dehydrogenase family protein [Bifidobacteriaceae bacterium]